MTFWAAAAVSIFLQQSPKASIEGYVVRAGTNEPIPRAQITVQKTGTAEPVPPQPGESEEFARIPAVTTDSQGRFIIQNLDAGTYDLSAARNGFARQQYGERSPGRPGTVLKLAAAQTVTDIVFRLIPAGAVGGRVSDASGEPIPGMIVQLLKSVYDARGKRRLEHVGNARTDERGQYRMYLVTPGRYFLSATPSPDRGSAIPNEVYEPGYVVTYYPGSSDASAAAAIEIQPGDELSNIDFRLNKQQLFRIRGRVFDTRTGKPPGMINLNVLSRDRAAIMNRHNGAMERYDARTGTFELRDVPPGSYWVQAQALPDTRSITQSFSIADLITNFAQTAIDVSNSDVENVTLSFASGFRVTGRITIEGSTATYVPNLENITVFLEPDESSPVPSLPGEVKADGAFVLERVQPGNYRLHFGGVEGDLRKSAYIKSVFFGGRDVLNGISLSGPVSDVLEVVVSTAVAEIEGTVIDKDQKPMQGIQAVLIPTRERDRRDLYRTATTDQRGQFKISTVVPGEYKLFAWEDLEPFAYNDPDFLRKFEDRGTPVKLAESAKVTVETKIIPAGQ